MNIFLRFLGVGLVLMGLALFFLCFWVLAPAVSSLIPKGEWKGFLDFLVYLVIAWIGGTGVPAACIFGGVPLIVWGGDAKEDTMEKEIVVLGRKCIDSVSGFSGVAVSRHTYLNGCARISLQPGIDKDGKLPEVQTFDEPQLRLLPEIEAIKGDNSTGGPEKYAD